MDRLAADRMLGKLAKWLRVLGHDVIYLRQAGDPEVVAVLEEGRILLTRNRRAAVWHKHGKVLAVEANNPKEQLLEVARKLPLLQRDAVPFSRCLECNRILRSATRKEVRYGSLKNAVFKEDKFVRDFSLVYKKSKEPAHTVEQFMAFLRRYPYNKLLTS